MLSLKKITQIAAIVALTALPLLSLAQLGQDPARGTFTPDVTSVEQIYQLVQRIARWIQTFFFLIAGVFIVLAAFGYLTAGGDEEKVKSAKQKLVYAIVAIVVAVFAFVVATIIANFIGGTTEAP